MNLDGVSRTYNAANQLVHDGVHTITYDADGNLTSDGTHTYTWDRAGRLLSMGGHSYAYNGYGVRISQTVNSLVTSYLNDTQPGLPVMLSQTTNGSTDCFVHLPGHGILAQQDNTGDWTWPLADGLRSVRSVVNDDLSVDSVESYEPFGTPLEPGAFGSPFMFTGELLDANGLLYLRARYYAPGLGVFTGLDPVENLNRYQYVGGNVINAVDPSGRFFESPSAWDSCLRQTDSLCEKSCCSRLAGAEFDECVKLCKRGDISVCFVPQLFGLGRKRDQYHPDGLCGAICAPFGESDRSTLAYAECVRECSTDTLSWELMTGFDPTSLDPVMTVQSIFVSGSEFSFLLDSASGEPLQGPPITWASIMVSAGILTGGYGTDQEGEEVCMIGFSIGTPGVIMSGSTSEGLHGEVSGALGPVGGVAGVVINSHSEVEVYKDLAQGRGAGVSIYVADKLLCDSIKTGLDPDSYMPSWGMEYWGGGVAPTINAPIVDALEGFGHIARCILGDCQ